MFLLFFSDSCCARLHATQASNVRALLSYYCLYSLPRSLRGSRHYPAPVYELFLQDEETLSLANCTNTTNEYDVRIRCKRTKSMAFGRNADTYQRCHMILSTVFVPPWVTRKPQPFPQPRPGCDSCAWPDTCSRIYFCEACRRRAASRKREELSSSARTGSSGQHMHQPIPRVAVADYPPSTNRS